jgi:branched-chain amino acid transport system permease protein
MRAPSWAGRVALLALLVVAVLVPLYSSPYIVGLLSMMLTYGVAVLGINLLMGFTGMISLGHGALFAIGAYTTAILMRDTGLPYVVTVLAAALLTFLLGCLVGFPARRLSGLHFAVITLGAALLVTPLLKRNVGLTGGAVGLQIDRPEAPFGLAEDQWAFYVCLMITVVVLALVLWAVRGPIGRAMLAVKDNPLAAEAMGVNTARLKIVVFAIASMLGGVAGSMYAFSVGYVAPDSFSFNLTVFFLAASVVGGARSIVGALLGSVVVVAVPVLAGEVNPALANIVFGLALIIAVVVLPNGIAGAVRARRRAADPEPPVGPHPEPGGRGAEGMSGLVAERR